jgi:hypothetical protein
VTASVRLSLIEEIISGLAQADEYPQLPFPDHVDVEGSMGIGLNIPA